MVNRATNPSRVAWGHLFVLLLVLPTGPAALGDGLIIDEDVLQLMTEQPDAEHSLILTVALTRPPLDLQALLPTVDELNTCTAKWQAWEDLVHRKAAGESVTATEVAAALEAAQLYDGAVLGKYESAYAAYQKDYQAVVAESLPPVLMLLQGYFGDKVRWPHQKSQMLVASLKSVDLPALFDIPGVQRVSCNPEFGPMLDVSRLDIRADLVHAGQGGVGPYTGAGVKVAIVDNGVRAGHPRLPTVAEYDQCDFTKDPAEIGEGDDECCVAHGSWVAGVVFCKYDSRDAYRGIASEGPAGPSAPGATLVNARVQRKWSTLCGLTFSETWAGVDYPALHWCAAINAGAGARVINFSRGAPLVSQGFTTRADDLTALNVDSLVDTFGVCVVHSCGNAQSTPSLSPPSGAFNLFSIGGYDDGGSPVRTDNVIWAGTSPGPTADPNPRRKPDLCAPAVSIITTEQLAGFTLPPEDVTGTSFAAPHVAGACALLLEGRPSLSPRQIHAILIATCDFAPGQINWDPKGGWGMLDAYRAVEKRNTIIDGSIDVGQTKTYTLARPAPAEEVVVACAWQRRMIDEITPLSGSPAKLKLRLERRLEGASQWELVQDQTEEAINNVQRVWATQGSPGSLYDFRVQVQRLDTYSDLVEYFTLASRHRLTFVPSP